MKTAHKLIFTLAMTSCVSLAHAKSPCHILATTEFFNSSISPTISTPESIKDAKAYMADGETFCKLMVQAIKTKKTTSDALRSEGAKVLAEGKEAFEKDGDMDKLELAKYMQAMLIGSAKIADSPP